MSQADATSLEGEGPATTGCYKQYDHAMAKPPTSTDNDQFQSSPSKDRRYSMEGPESPEKRLLINPEATPDKKMADKQLDLEQLPSEFECCFCTFKGYKEFIDAEQLMPMATSDLRQPVCVELACLQRHPAPRALPEATPNSLDSPDTFASCLTHPFPSEGDMTCELDSSNLYVNPLDGSGSGGGSVGLQGCEGSPAGVGEFKGVRKSASGDGNVLCAKVSQGEVSAMGSRALDASRASLPQQLESSVEPAASCAPHDAQTRPKHRKARFQQEWTEEEKKPPRGIATIINHHMLFGKNGGKKEGDSRSRSILKNRHGGGTDSELLIQDTSSLGANGDSGSESSPIRLKDFNKSQNHKGGHERDNLVS